MSSEQERILALARDAWQATQPSDAESEFAAKRIERRMRSERPRSSRRPTVVLVFVVVLLGGLAYAASGGPAHFGERASGGDAARGALRGAARAGLAEAPRHLSGVSQDAAERRAAAPADDAPGDLDSAGVLVKDESSATADKPSAKSLAGAAPEIVSPPPAASWRAVDEALDARDDARARKALADLAKSKDGATRAKARLGLAQLAKSRGDCAEARRLAAEVIAMSDVDPSLEKRAHAIELGCQ